VAALAPLGMGLPRLLGDAGAPVLPALAIAALGSALARRLARDEPSLLPRKLLTFATAFLVLAAGSAAASSVRGETLFLLLEGRVDPLVVNVLGMTAAERTRDAALAFLGLVLLLLALDAFSRLSLDPDGRDRLLLWTCAGGAAALLVAAAERFRPLDPLFQPWSSMQRRAATFTDPNALGVGIGLLAPLLLAALVARGVPSDGPRRAAALAGLVAAPVALESSGSRTGFLLLGAAALFAAVGLLRRRRVRPLVLAASAAALLGAGLLASRLLPRDGAIASGGLVSRLGAALAARDFSSFANHRVMFWRTAFETIADEPLSGVGLAGFPYEFPAAHARRHGPVAVTDGATNALLDVAAETGLPGLLLALLAVVPLLARAFDAAFARGALDPLSRAAGAALGGFFVACQTGSHLRFFEIGLLASLVAGFVLVPHLTSRANRPPEPEVWKPARTAAILAGAGVLASAAAVLPTARPESPFRVSAWAGVYPARPGNPFHWAGPLVYRGIGPGETSVSFHVQNARPDGRPVGVRVDVDGRPEPPLEVPGGETRDVRLDVPPGARIVRVRSAPSFVPRDLAGGDDRRRLAIRLSGEGL
jgi:O-antigen ligase